MRIGFYLTAIGSALFMTRVLAEPWNTHFRAVWPDAVFPNESYMAVAGLGPFRPSFYFAFRPIGYPLLLWMFGRSSHLVVIAQTALYCAAVISLCLSAWRVLRSRTVAVVTIVVFLGIAVQARYAMWTTQILSESLSMSVGLLAVSVWWRFAAQPSVARARWGFVFFIGWMLIRDANVLPGVVVVVPLILLIAWLGTGLDRKIRRVLVAGTVAVVIAGGYSYLAEKSSHRARLSFHNTIGARVLPDKQLTDFFVKWGMPLDDNLRTRTGKSGLEDDFYKSTDPRFAKYRAWVDGEGRPALVASMLLEFPHYRDLMYKDLPDILKGDVQYYDTYTVYNRLPRNMPLQLGGPTTRKGLSVWVFLATASWLSALVLALRRKRGRGLVIFGASTVILTMFEMYTTWVGDPIELVRHEIGGLQRLAIGLVIVIAIGVDAIVSALNESEPPTEEHARGGDEEPPSPESEAEPTTAPPATTKAEADANAISASSEGATADD